MFITSSCNYGSASKRVSNAGNAVARFARVGEIDKRQERRWDEGLCLATEPELRRCRTNEEELFPVCFHFTCFLLNESVASPREGDR